MSDSERVQELREEVLYLGGATFISAGSMVLFGLALVVDAWQTEPVWMVIGLLLATLAFAVTAHLGLRAVRRNRRPRRVSDV